MRTYWTFIRSSQFAPLFRLIHAEIHNFPDLARFYAEEVVARGHRLIAGIISRGIEAGEFRAGRPSRGSTNADRPFVMHGLWCTHRECFASVAKKTDERSARRADAILPLRHSAVRSRSASARDSNSMNASYPRHHPPWRRPRPFSPRCSPSSFAPREATDSSAAAPLARRRGASRRGADRRRAERAVRVCRKRRRA